MIVNKAPMGWNTWNTFGPNINEKIIMEAADAMVEKGLLDAGYEYLVIDDCWSLKQRDPVTRRLIADPEKFPNGMKAVADYVHSKGLKFGMYSCAGVRTCGDYPGSFDHEFIDAETFAEFGIDFLKYDYCYRSSVTEGPILYHRMANALRATGRDIVFSACNWGKDDVYSWIRSTGAHLYRSTGDIFDNFPRMKEIASSQFDKQCYNTPGCFNDMDMLTVGMFGRGHVGTEGCTAEDYKMQFGLWCIMGSPLILGCDIRNIDDESLKLVKNEYLIAINQDIDGRQTFQITSKSWACHDAAAFVKKLENGDFALGVFNFADRAATVVTLFDEIGYPANCGLKFELNDCFTGEKSICDSDSLSLYVESRGTKIYRVKPVKR